MTGPDPRPLADDYANDGDDLSLESLREINERLAQRVADLELTVVEYRAQMSQVLSSASWKVTGPMRATASRARSTRIRGRRALRRLRHRAGTPAAVLLPGLFAPAADRLPDFSPLKRRMPVESLVRPEDADPLVTASLGKPRVLVLAHVHYPELWPDIDDRLARMPEAFDLIVTVTEGPAEGVIPNVLRRHPNARIEVFSNRGRDWAPVVFLANKGLFAGYSAVAKVHTKKSEHRIDGDGWRLSLLDGVLESPEAIKRIVDLLSEDRNVGMVVPTGHVSGVEHWGSDLAIVESLASRLPMAFDPENLKFPSGSMFWCRPWIFERLADLALGVADFESEAGQYDGTTAHALERLVGIFADNSGTSIVEAMDVKGLLASHRRSPRVRPRALAFYLPQFHEIGVNNDAWGEGFTDWVNVNKARPLFNGHRQPLLPNEELGEYDLQDPEVLRDQAELARNYGVDGLVFHYYWFNGRKLLESPLENLLADPTIDLPFALSWANEPWTRRWDGLDNEVLVPQLYTEGWAERFWNDVWPALSDRRYICVDGKPLLIIYRFGQLPQAAAAISLWRRLAQEHGLPGLHILAVLPSREFDDLSHRDVSLVDGLVAFPPGSAVTLASLAEHINDLPADFSGDVLSYDSAPDAQLPGFIHGVPVHPGVMPGWDNTARRGEAGYVFHGANPVTWAGHVRKAAPAAVEGQELLFINAWNEWAEGAVLEPSRRFGRSYLSSLRDALGVQTNAKVKRQNILP